MSCYTDVVYVDGVTPRTVQFCVSQDSLNVNVTLKSTVPREDLYLNWTMKLQRQRSGGGWDTVGTRTGFLTFSSPSNRTFTNVAKKNANMRVFVDFKETNSMQFHFKR